MQYSVPVLQHLVDPSLCPSKPNVVAFCGAEVVLSDFSEPPPRSKCGGFSKQQRRRSAKWNGTRKSKVKGRRSRAISDGLQLKSTLHPLSGLLSDEQEFSDGEVQRMRLSHFEQTAETQPIQKRVRRKRNSRPRTLTLTRHHSSQSHRRGSRGDGHRGGGYHGDGHYGNHRDHKNMGRARRSGRSHKRHQTASSLRIFGGGNGHNSGQLLSPGWAATVALNGLNGLQTVTRHHHQDEELDDAASDTISVLDDFGSLRGDDEVKMQEEDEDVHYVEIDHFYGDSVSTASREETPDNVPLHERRMSYRFPDLQVVS